MREEDEERTRRGPGPTGDSDEATESDAGLAAGGAATPEEAAAQPAPDEDEEGS